MRRINPNTKLVTSKEVIVDQFIRNSKEEIDKIYKKIVITKKTTQNEGVVVNNTQQSTKKSTQQTVQDEEFKKLKAKREEETQKSIAERNNKDLRKFISYMKPFFDKINECNEVLTYYKTKQSNRNEITDDDKIQITTKIFEFLEFLHFPNLFNVPLPSGLTINDDSIQNDMRTFITHNSKYTTNLTFFSKLYELTNEGRDDLYFTSLKEIPSDTSNTPNTLTNVNTIIDIIFNILEFLASSDFVLLDQYKLILSKVGKDSRNNTKIYDSYNVLEKDFRSNDVNVENSTPLINAGFGYQHLLFIYKDILSKLFKLQLETSTDEIIEEFQDQDYYINLYKNF